MTRLSERSLDKEHVIGLCPADLSARKPAVSLVTHALEAERKESGCLRGGIRSTVSCPQRSPSIEVFLDHFQDVALILPQLHL